MFAIYVWEDLIAVKCSKVSLLKINCPWIFKNAHWLQAGKRHELNEQPFMAFGLTKITKRPNSNITPSTNSRSNVSILVYAILSNTWTPMNFS